MFSQLSGDFNSDKNMAIHQTFAAAIVMPVIITFFLIKDGEIDYLLGNVTMKQPSLTQVILLSLFCLTVKSTTTVYDFTVRDLDGNDVSLSKYQGKVLLIVNLATLCALTLPNYKQLNDLYSEYKDDGFMILGFPSDQFKEEPGTDAQIKEFIKRTGVEWDVFGKVDVNGPNADPLFTWLKESPDGSLLGLSSLLGNDIKWNFAKFLVDRQGLPVKRYPPTTLPSSIADDIIPLLQVQ